MQGMEKRTLLCWNYERRSWLVQFEAIFEPGTYCFINFFSKELEQVNNTREEVFYWNDFKNIDDLLARVDPGKVVFMGLDSPYSFLLNHACKQKGIPTYFLQHGIFHSYKAYLYEEAAMKSAAAAGVAATGSPVPRRDNHFFLHSLRFGRLFLYYRIVKFLLLKKIFGSTQRALKAIAGETMQAGNYLVYTKYLSAVLQERDKVPDHKITALGNYEANEIIGAVTASPGYSYEEGNYLLFIDEAFAGSPAFKLKAIVAIDAYNRFLQMLSGYAASVGKRLCVKLHPYSYQVDHFIKDDNIDYVREVPLNELILHAAGIFGFSSTLLIPALYVKKACVFRLNGFSDIHKALKEMDYCKVLDFHGLQAADIGFAARSGEEQVKKFVDYFLYKADNKYLDRLKKALVQD